MRNFWKSDNDPSRCDKVALHAPAPPTVVTAVPLIATPVAADSLVTLARRRRPSHDDERLARSAYTVSRSQVDSTRCVSKLEIQDSWDAYMRAHWNLCSANFWELFLSMHTYAGNAIDSALKVVKRNYVHDRVAKKRFPISRRELLSRTSSLPPFWSQVLHTYRVDLTPFASKLPSGTTHLNFTFVDPIWAWVIAARKQHPLDLHWKPIAQRQDHNRYGGGIQYGEFFAQACRDMPDGAYPLLIGLHWDGTSALGVSSDPVCVCVGNTNVADKSTQYCIGYLPHPPDKTKKAWRESPISTKVKFYIRQKCMGAILRVIKLAATRGVVVRLKNQLGSEVERVLFARLSSMNFDQPEAQLVFGLQNKWSCTKCRRRAGCSCFRVATPHTRAEIQLLYHQANDTTLPNYQQSRKTLKHRGFNFARRCCLLDPTFDPLFVNVLGRNEVYPCLDYRDRMHGLVIFLHRILSETLDAVVYSIPLRKVLDRRLASVCKRAFRIDGKASRLQETVLSGVGMTAADKYFVVMILSHVLGPTCGGNDDNILPAYMMLPLLEATAQAQVMLLASSGGRLYSERELRVIFDRGFLNFFTHIERVRELLYEHRVRLALESAEPPPKRYKPMEKRDSATETDDTDEDCKVGGLGVFSHSTHCLTHQHWVDQIISAGGFGVHCTQAAESSHKVNMHLASQRVKHGCVNVTQEAMLQYLCRHRVFEQMRVRSRAAPHTKTPKPGVGALIRTPCDEHGVCYASLAFQRSFMHREVRLSGAEFLDLVCDKLGLPKSRNSYRLMKSLRFQFGQKLTTADGMTLWGTDSQYHHRTSDRTRRDMLRLKGIEDGNALCCETICFVEITNAGSVGHGVDSITFVVGRWLEPHPDAWDRDAEHRPVCPGPLRANNCLWRYVKTTRDRRSLTNDGGTCSESFVLHRAMFGDTRDEQNLRRSREMNAYYGLIKRESIINKMNMCNTFVGNTSEPVYDTWLQSVHLS